MFETLSQSAAAVAAFIAARPARTDARFEALALDLFAFQFAHNPPYQALCRQQGRHPDNVSRWQDIPAAPAAAFKVLPLTVLPAAERTTVFYSSGTTTQTPSRHWHSATSLAVYEASLLAWAEPHLRLRTDPVRRLALLAPDPATAPHSSLAHMLDVLRRAHPDGQTACLGHVSPEGTWAVDHDRLLAFLREAEGAGEPVAVLGTAFQFVHALDAFATRGRSLRLPTGSRLMETGGYKGRSRALPQAELHQQLARALGLRPEDIVTEYGMSELGSQAYDAVAGHPAPRILRFPPWARPVVLSPETGGEVAAGATGLLRVVDLANVASVSTVQTEDLVERHGDGFLLRGRATAAEPRGCSLLSA